MTEPIIIDFTKDLDAIKRRHNPNFQMKKEAVKEAAELWGVTCNKFGVPSNITTETIIEVGKLTGEVKFAATTKGFWLTGLSVSHFNGGRGYAPSVWNNLGYATYHDARLSGVIDLEEYFNGIAKTAGKSEQANIQKVLTILAAEKTPQLDLF